MKHMSSLISRGSMLFTLLLFTTGLASANQAEVLAPEHGTYGLLGRLEVLEDPSGELTHEQVSEPAARFAWQKSDDEIPSFGYTASAYWFRLSFAEALSPGSWVFEIGYPPLDKVSFYYQKRDGTWGVKETGDSRVFKDRGMNYRNPTFVLDSADIRLIYVRVKSQGVLKLPLKLWRSEAFAEHVSHTTLAYGLYFGIMLAMILYNLFIYFSTRRLSYLFYVLYITSFGFAMLTLVGFSFQYLWQKTPELNAYMLPLLEALSLTALSVFMASYLYTKEQTPRLHKLLAFLGACSLLIAGSVFVFGYDVAIKMVTLGVLIFVIFVFVMSFVRLRMGFRPAKYFLIAFSSLLVGVFLFALTSAGILPSLFITENGLHIGSLLEVVLLSLGLADRMNLAQEEADAVNTKLIKELTISEKAEIQGRQKIEALNADLLEKERARTIFFHNTSHELRTPLNGVIGYIDLLQKGHYGNLGSQALAKINKVRSLTESLKIQVNTILDLARSQSGSLKLCCSRIPLAEILEESLILGESLSIRRPNLTFEYGCSWKPEERPTFINDREHVIAIIRNLLGNAFKFCDPLRHNRVRLSLVLKQNQLVIEVDDTGIGIPKDKLEDIFEEFKQVDEGTRRAYEGTGLGLAMVKQLVELMGGSVKVSSDLGQGSQFQVTLPEQSEIHVVEASAKGLKDELLLPADLSKPQELLGAVSQVEKSLIMAKSQPFDIVAIDDNEVNCDVIREILASHNYSVEVFTDSRLGLARIKQRKPDLLLLDLMMPLLSGEDILVEVRKSPDLANIPVILLTARASQEDRMHGLALGADDYMAKPLLSEEVVLRVRNTLSRASLVKETAARMTIESTLAEAQEVYKALGYDAERVPGVDIAYHFQSAEITGGDWFGIHFDEASQRLYCFVGDVTGHGVPAALVTIAVAGAVSGALSVVGRKGQMWGPEEALIEIRRAANEAVKAASLKMDRGMTMFFSCLDVKTGLYTYLNAGHIPPYWINHTKQASLIQPSSPLGFVTGESALPQSLHFGVGDYLVLYTDGLLENAGPDGKHVSHRAMRRILAYGLSPDEAKAGILAETQRISQGQALEDDCTFVIFRWLSPNLLPEASAV